MVPEALSNPRASLLRSPGMPLCIDLFCGLGGWTEGFLAEGWDVIGFDIERHQYGEQKYPAQLVIQDVLTLHGSQFRDADCIVASPPCQRYSYMAMPWGRSKREVRWQIWEEDSPFGDKLESLNALFVACFRIQREACEAAGRHIPLVVENVKGAQPWVGRAKADFGSFYLWGDVAQVGGAVVAGKLRFGELARAAKRGRKVEGFNFHQFEKTGEPGGSFQSAAVKTTGHVNIRDGHSHTRHLTNQRESDGIKQHGSSATWFDIGISTTSSGSASRKAASAQIAKIPLPLSSYIARSFRP